MQTATEKLWLFQETEHVSSDDISCVHVKQPYDETISHNKCHQVSKVNVTCSSDASVHQEKYVIVGDLCAFKFN